MRIIVRHTARIEKAIDARGPVPRAQYCYSGLLEIFIDVSYPWRDGEISRASDPETNGTCNVTANDVLFFPAPVVLIMRKTHYVDIPSIPQEIRTVRSKTFDVLS